MIVAVFCTGFIWAKAPEKTSLQHYADSLLQVCMEMNQINKKLRQEKDSIVAQIRAEYETDMNRYHTHINWNIAIIGLLFTGVLAGAGFLANKDVALKLTKTRKRIIGLNKDLKNYRSNLTQLNETLEKQLNENKILVEQLNEIKAHVDETKSTINTIKTHVDETETAINTIKTQIDISAKAAKESEEKASASALYVQAINEEDIDKQIELYNRCIVKDPHWVAPYDGLSIAYLCKKEFSSALDAVNKAIEVSSFSDPVFYDTRAFVLIAWGVYKKEHPDEYQDIDWKDDIRNALSDIEKAFSLSPYEELAEVLAERRDDCEKLLKEESTVSNNYHV